MEGREGRGPQRVSGRSLWKAERGRGPQWVSRGGSSSSQAEAASCSRQNER